MVKINQIRYPAHRVVYALHHGIDPFPMEVDHRDRNPTNNDPDNLRVATRSENARNKDLPANNTSGHRGVTFCNRTGKWMAQIGHEGRCLFLGRFDSAEKAAEARKHKEREVHQEFSAMHFEATRPNG